MRIETIDDLEQVLRETGHEITREGDVIQCAGDVLLDDVESLPDGVTLTAGGGIYLRNLTSLPDGVTLTVGWWIDLSSLTTLGDGVTLNAGGWIYLSSLTTLGDGVTLNAGWGIDLPRLTTLGDGVTLNAGKRIFLRSLNSLGDGVTLTAGGGIDLPRLPQHFTYRGRAIDNYDGIATEALTPWENAGYADCEVQRARKFRGEWLDGGNEVWIARLGEYYAHGATRRDAIDDVLYKRFSVTADKSEVVAEIRATQVVTREQYRLLTGACGLGVREFLARHKIGTRERALPLDRVLEMTRGVYGGEEFAAVVRE